MTIIDQLNSDSLNARKNKLPQANLLVTLIAEITMRAKNDGNRLPTDDDAAKVLDRFLKSLNSNRDMLKLAGRDFSATQDEIDILLVYVPTVMSEADTINEVTLAFTDADASGMKDMGKIMALLKERHGALIDMKLASVLYKDIVNAR